MVLANRLIIPHVTSVSGYACNCCKLHNNMRNY
ncbi:hypothetical protein [Citrobacter phage Tr1]|nr:hypothetical protein [Citrobacter phage Tr1]